MAHLAYLKLTQVRGTSIIKAEDRQNYIPILAVTHEQEAPIGDAGVLGPRKHTPLMVTKNIDFTSPRLHKALHEGEVFPSGHIHFFHMPRSGDETRYYKITMTNVRVVSIRSVMPSALDPKNAETHEYEEVGFVYQGINWTHERPPTGTVETGTYPSTDHNEPEAQFAPDWVELEAEAAAMGLINVAKEEAKKRIMDEAKKKAEELKKK